MNNFEVIELELLAILAALMMVKENSKVNIYTDNMGVVELSWSIKSHSNNLGNDLADGLCKAALLDKDGSINSEININNDYTWEYSVFWKNTIVKNWPASLNIIMKEFNDGISSLSNDSTAYNLKNYLEILPTFTMLNQRILELYETSRCCRCYETIEL
ncbi:unnamed protein product [Rhizophagus irregularis]|nr:unnamed protein product [Rhizophagus irregularis]